MGYKGFSQYVSTELSTETVENIKEREKLIMSQIIDQTSVLLNRENDT